MTFSVSIYCGMYACFFALTGFAYLLFVGEYSGCSLDFNNKVHEPWGCDAGNGYSEYLGKTRQHRHDI